MAKKKSKRKPISASLRWQVFARDNFTCRYCGGQAGQTGITLAVDHIVSVVDGGDNSIDNLLTACQNCNGGKGARSLTEMPDSEEVAKRMQERSESIRRQADAIQQSLDAQKQVEQEAINLKCAAYCVKRISMSRGEEGRIIDLCRQYGSDNVYAWYCQAYRQGVREQNAIKYVYGIIRNMKAEGNLD